MALDVSKEGHLNRCALGCPELARALVRTYEPWGLVSQKSREDLRAATGSQGPDKRWDLSTPASRRQEPDEPWRILLTLPT
jgi:hypothetical protein